ncbi:hypothetical protein BN948_00169 [Hydrogenophaga intermedia]|uniref:Transmembrane protein n=1 Tax=Hydrogenophaga intermedia TaxID=65786 RepID=A0A1L1PI74_HYDIT|nr:hypothetical protein [Hydrogenophaga intermedia]CDN85776.1 hypothetical protein BN948_00169 [Hydrogenophaga intermedia]
MAWRRYPGGILGWVLFIGFLPLMWPVLAIDLLCGVSYVERLRDRHPDLFKLLYAGSFLAWAVFLFSGGLS